jgi:HTH-type transcriptional regulator / antitoxin HigA
MVVKSIARKLPDSYFERVKQFPLTHILDEKHLLAAQAMIDRMLKERLDRGEQAYLDVLTDLVESYEDQHELIPDASEADVLRELMRANGLSQLRLSAKVGISQSTISAVLSGGRSLTKEHVVALACFFHVSPAAFFPASR